MAKSGVARNPLISTGTQVSIEDFNGLRALLRQETGIHLNDEKGSLIESRLGRRLRELELSSFADYRKYIKAHPDELTEFINALTTNKTNFFREAEHFEYLAQTVLPLLVPKLRGRPLFTWSAACSTGEEVYSLGIALNEYGILQSPAGGFDFRILGTDVDTNVLNTAEAGVYKTDSIVTAMRPDLVQRYFRGNVRTGTSQVSADLQSRVKFRKSNLFNETLPTGIQFDVIFLRNVLIYFSIETIQSVVEEIVRRLKPNGYLFIGHAESLVGIVHPLHLVGSSVFRKGSAE